MNTGYRMIQDAPVLGQTANAIAITWVNVQPFNLANVQYEMRSIEQMPMPSPDGGPSVMVPVPAKLLFASNITLSGDDYSGWGDDDQYLYETLASKLGLTLLPESPQNS